MNYPSVVFNHFVHVLIMDLESLDQLLNKIRRYNHLRAQVRRLIELADQEEDIAKKNRLYGLAGVITERYLVLKFEIDAIQAENFRLHADNPDAEAFVFEQKKE